MAFQVCKQGVFPLNDSYKGPTAVVQFSFNFVFLPGIDACTQLDAAVRAGMFGVGIIPLIKANYLRYTLEVDTSPFIDAYRVTIHLAGETQETEGTIQRPLSYGQPGALIIGSSLVALVLAIGVIILIFGPIAYRIFNGGLVGGGENGGGGLFPGLKIDTTTLVIGGAAIVGLLVLTSGGKRA